MNSWMRKNSTYRAGGVYEAIHQEEEYGVYAVFGEESIQHEGYEEACMLMLHQPTTNPEKVLKVIPLLTGYKTFRGE